MASTPFNKIFNLKAPGLVIKKSGISSTDDDINDVAAMGGVNIADENKVNESKIKTFLK